ncbi:MAG: glycosyltransferase [Chloroflexota bacterium]
MTKRVLILMSDTGGGHRAVANAIRDALAIRYGDEIETQVIDGLKEYTPAPIKYAPEIYPIWIARSKSSWGVAHNITDTPLRARSVTRAAYITLGRYFKQMLRDHPADVIVSAHALLVSPSLDALHSFADRPPFVTVITDYASTHHFWYDDRADAILVPTKPALDRGLRAGVRADKLKITGLPVNPSFAQRLEDKTAARTALGWLSNKTTILMLGGGEGMGPLFQMAREINRHNLDIQLVIVAGKNKQLKRHLESVQWNQPTRIYPFTREMPRLMSGADIIVTKAGAASVTEAVTAGLPIIISDVIPGQETGNMEYVVKSGAGEYPGTPAAVGETVARWVKAGPTALAARAAKSASIARPDAAFDAAEAVYRWAQHGRITNDRRSSILNRIEDIRSNLLP